MRVDALQQFLWSAVPAMRPRLLDRMRTEFPDHQYTKAAFATYDPASQIRAGQNVPPFAIASLSGPGKIYSHDSIPARVYLIDFWATWCGPCTAEMPSLHRVYGAYHDKGFEILSVSLDESREVVEQFRTAKFPMPWLNAIDADLKAFESKMSKDFGVYGVPRAFLVGRNGEILATDEDLRGEKLERTIARLFPETP